ncbi:MAG: DUF4388 domain-containing protein [Alphaproteobacteria bacterium]
MAAKSILLIEPSEAERGELAAVFEKMGYEVNTAAGSDEGLRLFAEGRQDLVIVEVLLPGINGLKVCKIVKEQGVEWEVKVIVISKVYQSRAMEYDAINRYSADAYMAQPFPMLELLDKVSALIGEGDAGLREQARETGEAAVNQPATETPTAVAPELEVEPEPIAAAPEPPPVEPPPAAAASEEAEFVESEVPADEGEFTPEQLGLLLVRLARDKADGVLLVKRDKDTKHIYFIEGRPVFVQSTNREESLGRMLLEDGVLNDEQYREAMVQMGESGKKLGTVLTRLGYLTNEELFYQLTRQTRRKVARCFAWPNGEFKISREARYPENAPTFETNYTAIVLDGYREYIDPARLEDVYNEEKGKYLFRGDAEVIAAMRVFLSDAEAKIMDTVDGSHTLSEVVGESELGLVDTLRVVLAMVNTGAVRLASIEKKPDLSQYETDLPPAAELPESDPRDQALYREIKEFAVRLDDMDLFDVLGLDRDATDDDINRAYLTRQKVFSADRLSPLAPRSVKRNAATVMTKLQEAYDVLRDPQSRNAYLRQLSERGDVPEASQAASVKVEEVDEKVQPLVAARRYFQEGVLALEKKRYAWAVDSFNHATRLDPKNADYRARLAQSMYKLLAEPAYSWTEVEEAAKQALALDKKQADMLALIGRIKAKQGDDEMALRYFKKAQALDPSDDQLRREIHYTEQRLQEQTPTKKKSLFGKIL